MLELLNYFKAVLVEENQKTNEVNTVYLDRGIILNFVPTSFQELLIQKYIQDNWIRTLFSVNKAVTGSLNEKVFYQLVHYTAAYWFDLPEAVIYIEGNDKPLTLTRIRGVTFAELQKLIDDILYANKPAKDTEVLAKIITELKIPYQLDKIKNNELRIQLFDINKNIFQDGDDAVRWIVFKCTKNALLIKSTEVITQIQENAGAIPYNFLDNHLVPLSRCFNRHKRIILALKVGSDSTAIRASINRIARASKKAHIPIPLAENKTFINDALRSFGVYEGDKLDRFSTRDLFKYLNLLAFKKLQLNQDIFIIRNGKTWFEMNRPIHEVAVVDDVERMVITALKKRLEPILSKKLIIQPQNIDYGLPTTRKQAIGHLPFGTKITVDGELSSGIYWKNEWGATDLDLSTVDENGDRVGWGQISGYNYKHGKVLFSGDIVQAPNGAMEFVTSFSLSYGLFVNIYCGEIGCEGELLVGQRSSDKWIEHAEIRERFKLQSRNNLIGFVNGKEFTVFLGRLSQTRTTFNANTVVLQKGKSYIWTIKKLLDACNIPWYIKPNGGKVDHDLSYANFTFDKLEELFAI